MTENQVLQIFLRLLHREQQEYQDKTEKREGLFSKIAKRMRKGEKI